MKKLNFRKKIKVVLMTTVLISTSSIAQVNWNNTAAISGTSSSVLGGWNTATGDYSLATGNNNTSSGQSAVSFGALNVSSGDYSITAGYDCSASSFNSIAFGSRCISSSYSAISIGDKASALNSQTLALGNYVTVSGNRAAVFGTGVGPGLGEDLINNVDNSLMIGYQSTIPTLFVGPGNGIGTLGKVGIGTTNTPTTIGAANIGNYTLYVKGGLLSEEVRVRTGWADYVFMADYQLQPLEDVEKYINTFGHLPNVPSSTQVESEGIELGDITRIQQEKIEELTLYLIDLQKQINALKEQLEKEDN